MNELLMNQSSENSPEEPPELSINEKRRNRLKTRPEISYKLNL